ncbi:hypothetical protein [Blastopirellula marina]|uniref:hypothetical protein n=1 Tax=Blastopirellula marina TaxID=124 RepID=UPI000325801A|nr:hypothetical protein [Blastopirellula marina]
MADAARAFDEQRGGNILRGLPGRRESAEQNNVPWRSVREGEMPPMMFQLRLRDGGTISYPYSDVREIRCRDAGCVQVSVLGMAKMIITLEGRRLRELADLLGRAELLWIEEADPRDVGRPESAPEIVSISIEEIDQ